MLPTSETGRTDAAQRLHSPIIKYSGCGCTRSVENQPAVGVVDTDHTVGFTGDVAFEDSSRASVGLGFDLQLGAWTVLLSYRVLDRGDAEAPGTLLPVVQGGFSQSQFMFGVRRSLAGKR